MLPLTFSVAILIITRNNHKLLGLKFLVMLGLISYPLYLWHYPLIAFSNIFGISSPSLPFIQLILAVVLGWITYRYVEVYARRITDQSIIVTMAVFVVSIGLLGFYFKDAQGFPNRAHIQNALGNLKQLERTSASDSSCDAITAQAGVIGRLFPYCRASTAQFDAPFVALIVDSHAHAAYSGFSDALKKKNFESILLSNSSCPSFIGGEMGNTLKAVDKCAAKISQIFKVLQNLPNLKKVIIVARGPTYSEEKGFGEIEKNWEKRPDKFRSFFANPDCYDASRDYFSSLEQSIVQLNKQHVQVYLLLENPELGFLPQSCIDRPYGVYARDCRVAFQAFEGRMKAYRGRIQQIHLRNPSLILLDPAEFLCDQKWCYGMKEGGLLYADDDHLSVLGSNYIAEKLINKFGN